MSDPIARMIEQQAESARFVAHVPASEYRALLREVQAARAWHDLASGFYVAKPVELQFDAYAAARRATDEAVGE